MTNTYTHSYKPKSKIMTTTTTTPTTKTNIRKIQRGTIKIPYKMIKLLSIVGNFQMLRWKGTNSSYKMPLHKARSQGR